MTSKIRPRLIVRTVLTVVVAMSAVVLAVFAVERHRARRPESFAPVPGNAGKCYECRPPAAVPAESVWPMPRDAAKSDDDIYSKIIRRGTGTRLPKVGSGQVVVLCVTYYDRDGSVRDHDAAAIIELDPTPSRTAHVASLMTEGEIRRVWMPDREGLNGTLIADFEMEPWPQQVGRRFGSSPFRNAPWYQMVLRSVSESVR